MEFMILFIQDSNELLVTINTAYNKQTILNLLIIYFLFCKTLDDELDATVKRCSDFLPVNGNFLVLLDACEQMQVKEVQWMYAF